MEDDRKHNSMSEQTLIEEVDDKPRGGGRSTIPSKGPRFALHPEPHTAGVDLHVVCRAFLIQPYQSTDRCGLTVLNPMHDARADVLFLSLDVPANPRAPRHPHLDSVFSSAGLRHLGFLLVSAALQLALVTQSAPTSGRGYIFLCPPPTAIAPRVAGPQASAACLERHAVTELVGS